MTPDIVVDIGNSRMKWGYCDGPRVTGMVSLAHDAPVDWKRQAQLWGLSELTRWAVAGVVPHQVQRFCDWLAARGITPAVITNDLFAAGGPTGFITKVDEPHRIGIDRLLASYAAYFRPTALVPVAVINVGTAMTIDLVKADGVHVGGVILPGPRLMAKSLRQHTAKLPEVDIHPAQPTHVWGTNTETAIKFGIANAVIGAADEVVWDWAVHVGQPVGVFATGGDVGYLRGFVFTADVTEFTIDPHLNLDGVRLAAEKLP